MHIQRRKTLSGSLGGNPIRDVPNSATLVLHMTKEVRNESDKGGVGVEGR